MLQIEVSCPASRTPDVLALLEGDPVVSSLSVARGASLRPEGDVVTARVPREAANELLDALRRLGVQRDGSVVVQPISTWMSQSAYDAEVAAPGAGADAVVWADVVQRAYDDSALTWTYLTFMTLATVIASIAIVLDSIVLVIGAMVLGPEFGAIAALGLALVRRRRTLLSRALITLLVGFAVGIAVTTVVALVARGAGWISASDLVGPRLGTGFIYSPDKWSFVIALIAGAAGVLAITSSRSGGLVGVFISVTTIPAAGNAALALALGVWSELWPSLLQLVINVTGMALAGWLTLGFQQVVWRRVAVRPPRRAPRSDEGHL